MTSPSVSVGLPVYNGANYVAAAIESILDQTYADLELIINDNASTDETEAICRAYAARDDRVLYARNENNLGASANYNATVDRARGRFFKWIAHDDLTAPAFFERCVEVLEADSSVSLAYPTPRDIDQDGKLLAVLDSGLGFDGPSPSERFRRTYEVEHSYLCFFGVTRLDVLRQTARHGSYLYADRVLVSELSLWGRIHEVPEELLFRRLHEDRYVDAKTTYEDQLAWHDTSRTGTIAFPRWRYYKELGAAVRRSPVSPRDRSIAFGLVAKWAAQASPGLAKDLVNPARRRLMPKRVTQA